MKAFRFLHAADLHLDSPFAGMASLPLGIRTILRQSTFIALANLVSLAIRSEVDFVLISGDVYDLTDRSLRAQIRFQKALQTLTASGIAVYIVHGNHDPEDGRAAKLHWPERVHFFSAAEVECMPIIVQDKGIVAQVYGMSYATSAITENLALRLAEKLEDQKKLQSHVFWENGQAGSTESGNRTVSAEEIYRIGLLHANVDGDQAHANYAPCSKRDLLQSGMDYWALGHVHTRAVLHTEPAIVYPGNIQGRSVRETGAKGCYAVEVTEYGETKLVFHPLDAVRWQQRTASIQGIQSEQELKELLERELELTREAAEGRAAVVRITLTGRSIMHSVLQKGTYLAELLAELREEEAKRVGTAASWDASLEAGGHSAWDTVTGQSLLLEAEQADFVWIESVQVQSGSEVDQTALLEQKSFLGDLMRISESLLADEEAFRLFCAETLDPMFAQGKAAKYLSTLSIEDRQEWLKAAQELAIDFLAADAGWDE
jgi:exonuclease SbcD